MKNILMIILGDPSKLSISTFLELREDLEKLSDEKSTKIKNINRFENEERFTVKELKNIFDIT